MKRKAAAIGRGGKKKNGELSLSVSKQMYFKRT